MDALGGSSWATELALFHEALLALNETLPTLLVLSGNMTHASPSQKYYGPQRDAFHASLSTLDPRIRLVRENNSLATDMHHDLGRCLCLGTMPRSTWRRIRPTTATTIMRYGTSVHMTTQCHPRA